MRALAAKESMKYFFILFFCSFYSLASVPKEKIHCPEYNETLALELEPNKKYFKDTVRARVESVEATDAEIFNFVEQFGENERRIKLTSNESLANEIGATIVYSMEYYRDKYFGRKNHLTTHHVPAAVTYKTPYGYLAGDSQGEFGGELVFVDNSGSVQLIQDMNVEDIYEFKFGYVVTEGLSHMSSDNGMLYLVTFLNKKPHLTKLFGLIGAPKSSLKLANGDLLINSREGSQILKSDGSLVRVSCKGS
ncbi:hypothetical protein AN214_00065 [Pseudoalteromonas sp. P1-9]|uniref:hypothetical protein n=1 Tax=Pseudoalteromonas sp. P1-9 TaxID=1710354 RepID=UPI0006D5D8D4|nr:hypothetical protein [Pseudoalteromonas sp. P1-9]KPV98304.1 hypothetical protein AN214_00065 [Pseudoalteromonas sp. P1-9]